MEEILVNVNPLLTRVAHVKDGRLIDLVIEPSRASNSLGNIYLGRVRSVVPTLSAAFVDIGLAQDGVLSAADASAVINQAANGQSLQPIRRLVQEGSAVMVQVAREAFGKKGARLRSSIAISGRLLIYQPQKPGIRLSRRIVDKRERARLIRDVAPLLHGQEGIVVRTNANGIKKEVISGELKALRKEWSNILNRINYSKTPMLVYEDLPLVGRVIRDHVVKPETVILTDDSSVAIKAKTYSKTILPALVSNIFCCSEDRNLFDRHNLEEQIAEVMEPVIKLRGGGQIIIEKTTALTTIDVDTKHVVYRNAEEAALKTNIEAAEEVARQLRLRSIGGAVVIDFIQMRRDGDAKRVEDVLRVSVSEDPVLTKVGNISEFGLLEMTRQRTGPDLSEVVNQRCPTCQGTGSMRSRSSVAGSVLAAVERETVSSPGGSVAIFAAPQVIFEIESAADAETLSRRFGCLVTLNPDKYMALDDFDIIRN